jgi:hypothetical protein
MYIQQNKVENEKMTLVRLSIIKAPLSHHVFIRDSKNLFKYVHMFSQSLRR